MTDTKKYPHDNVYARIKPSPIHGVGIFAILDIPKGTDVFRGEIRRFVEIPAKEVEGADPELKKIYDDFCGRNGKNYSCPDSFNNLTPSWYLNHSKTEANSVCDEKGRIITLRDIKKGEELILDYSKYEEW